MKVRAGELEEGERFCTIHTNRTGTVIGHKDLAGLKIRAVLIRWDGEEYYTAERDTKHKPDAKVNDNLHPHVWVNWVYEQEEQEEREEQREPWRTC